ncbi:amidohydrolase family protein [Gordonia sp. NPDC003376]
MSPAPRVFDAHLHIIDPRFPLIENNGYLPPAFTVADYRARIAHLGIDGGAVVSGSFQAFDQRYLVAALQALGPGYVGVTQIPADASDAEILELDRHGVRAVRFNARRGGSADLAELDRLARRVHDLAGWHTELYIDSQALPDLSAVLRSLPAISVDHLGLSAQGLSHLLHLVESGARVKATGFGRIDVDPSTAIRQIMAVNPQALVVGTDLPSTRARRPFEDSDVDLIRDVVGDNHIDDVFWNNAALLYRIGR